MPTRPPSAVETAAYFVVAEALANAAKHSGSDWLDIRIATVGRHLELEIRDDGMGGAGEEGGDEEEGYYGYGNDMVKEGEGRLDANGQLVVAFDVPPLDEKQPFDFTYRLEAQVTDSSRREMEGKAGFVWTRGKLTHIGDLPGGIDWSVANDINNRGQVVGASEAEAGREAVLWEDGNLMSLGDLPGANVDSYAYAINDWGVVVGQGRTDAGIRPFIWRNGTMRELPIPEGNTLGIRAVGAVACNG